MITSTIVDRLRTQKRLYLQHTLVAFCQTLTTSALKHHQWPKRCAWDGAFWVLNLSLTIEARISILVWNIITITNFSPGYDPQGKASAKNLCLRYSACTSLGFYKNISRYAQVLAQTKSLEPSLHQSLHQHWRRLVTLFTTCRICKKSLVFRLNFLP